MNTSKALISCFILVAIAELALLTYLMSVIYVRGAMVIREVPQIAALEILFLLSMIALGVYSYREILHSSL